MAIGFEKFEFREDGRLVSCWIDESWAKDDFIGFVRNIERNLASSEIIKDSRSVEAGICVFRSGRLFLKRYNDRGVVHRLRHILRIPRALNALGIFTHLNAKRADVLVPRHVAAVCMRRPGFGQRFSYLIQNAVEDLIPPLEIVKLASSSDVERGTLMSKVSGVLALMHGAGVVHGDAKMTNFLFKKAPGGYICGMWDFDVSRIFRSPPVVQRERDLARAAASLIEISEKLSCGWDRAGVLGDLAAAYEKSAACGINRRRLERKTGKFL